MVDSSEWDWSTCHVCDESIVRLPGGFWQHVTAYFGIHDAEPVEHDDYDDLR